MTEFPTPRGFGIEDMEGVICSSGQCTPLSDFTQSVNRKWTTSQTWGTGSKALYIPFIIGKPILIKRCMWINSSTVSGNIDVGIYDYNGVRKVSSGSTALAGATAVQSIDITDTLLAPGYWFMAMVLDNTTHTMLGAAMDLGAFCRYAGVREEASAFPLPANATFASTGSTESKIPQFSFTLGSA